ncbi:MAG: hypothetical protein HQ523_11775 [Lentisphaerae bacterium]|nr:hypothetical protein [Lentisphaerota bacterium]
MKAMRWFVALCMCSTMCGAVAAAAGDGPYMGKPFLGIYGATVPIPSNTLALAGYGVRIDWIPVGSSAQNVDLRLGDIVVALDGTTWSTKTVDLHTSFATPDGRTYPSYIATVQLLRADDEATNAPLSAMTVEVPISRYPRTAPGAAAGATTDVAITRPDYEALCWSLIRTNGLEADCRDLLDRLDRCEQYPDPDRLPIVRAVHRDPFLLEGVVRSVVDPLATKRLTARDCPLLLERAEHVLYAFGTDPIDTLPDAAALIDPSYVGTDLEGHLDYITAVLAAAAAVHREVFGAVTEDDADYIRTHRAQLFDAFAEVKMLSYDRDRERQAASVRLLDIVATLDTRPLLRQAGLAALLVAPDFTASLRAAAEASGKDLSQATVVQRQTVQGLILVGGTGHSRYQQEIAALYDLGGDDVYANNQGSSSWPTIPTAVLVDYGGDDAYEADLDFKQGCGDMGVGLLVDCGGDDSYVGMRFTQGAGFLGVGLLIDEGGDDVYRGLVMHQGVGHWGAGILVDTAGNDRYEAHQASQAVGLPGGMGLLVDCGAGADSYYCKGTQPTGYGTPGVFEGWGQGMGFGYRIYASGGVGVLLDQGGSDRMESGNFSMGGGYFYGLGILYSGGTDSDHYIGSHYTQGFGCHQAVGAFIECGGNDRYQTRDVAGQGLAWDEAVALFLDEAGNDVYEGGGFSHGASAMNGWTLFIDREGDDTYLFAEQARAGGNTYHGGTSLSFFCDSGGGTDIYSKRENNSVVTGGVHAIFVDLPGAVGDQQGAARQRL